MQKTNLFTNTCVFTCAVCAVARTYYYCKTEILGSVCFLWVPISFLLWFLDAPPLLWLHLPHPPPSCSFAKGNSECYHFLFAFPSTFHFTYMRWVHRTSVDCSVLSSQLAALLLGNPISHYMALHLCSCCSSEHLGQVSSPHLCRLQCAGEFTAPL
jgi:hypothetical protein